MEFGLGDLIEFFFDFGDAKRQPGCLGLYLVVTAIVLLVALISWLIWIAYN